MHSAVGSSWGREPVTTHDNEEVDVPLPARVPAAMEEGASFQTISLEETKCPDPPSPTQDTEWDREQPEQTEFPSPMKQDSSSRKPRLKERQLPNVRNGCGNLMRAITPGEGMGWVSTAAVVESGKGHVPHSQSDLTA